MSPFMWLHLAGHHVRLLIRKSSADYCAARAAIVDNFLAYETPRGKEVEDIVSHWL